MEFPARPAGGLSVVPVALLPVAADVAALRGQDVAGGKVPFAHTSNIINPPK